MSTPWPPPTEITRPMVSDRWYDQQTAGIYDPTANLPMFTTPLYVFCPFIQWNLSHVNFAKIGFDIDAAPTLDVNIFLGLYSDINGQPAQKLKELEVTVLAADPAGPLEFPFEITLKPALYWFCFINETASGIRLNGWDGGSATEGFSLLGDDSPEGTSSIPKQWGWRSPVLVVYPATLPDSFATTVLNVNDRIPRLCLQVK